MPERVGDPLPGRRILEVAGIADQRPARPGGLAEESLELHHSEHLSDPVPVAQNFGDGLARPHVRHVGSLAVSAKLGQEAQRWEHDHEIQSGVGRHRDHEPPVPTVKDERSHELGVGVLEVTPIAEPLAGDDVVFARPSKLADGGVASIGSDDELGHQPAVLSIRADLDPRHAAAVIHQARDVCGRQGLGAGVRRCVEQDRVEHEPPHAHESARVPGALVDLEPDLEILLAQPHLRVGPRAGLEDGIEHPQPPQEVDRGRLEYVRRDGVLGKRRPLGDRNLQALARQQRRQRSSRASRSNDDYVERVLHRSLAFPIGWCD